MKKKTFSWLICAPLLECSRAVSLDEAITSITAVNQVQATPHHPTESQSEDTPIQLGVIGIQIYSKEI